MISRHTDNDSRHDAGDPAEAVSKAAPRIDSEAIFDGRSVVVIVHEGHEYVLRVTRNGKLILTK